MMDMPIRTGRRMQDAARNLREKISRKTNERQQVNSLHRQRMTCSGSVAAFTNAQDWTNSIGMNPSGRFQVVENTKARRKFFTREGIRMDAACAILAVVVFICVAILLADVAGIGLGSRSISRLDSKIADLTERNEQLKLEVSRNAGDASICTEAVKLNLISGNAAQTIHLSVPQELSAEAVTAEVRSASASTGWTSGSVGD